MVTILVVVIVSASIEAVVTRAHIFIASIATVILVTTAMTTCTSLTANLIRVHAAMMVVSATVVLMPVVIIVVVVASITASSLLSCLCRRWRGHLAIALDIFMVPFHR